MSSHNHTPYTNVTRLSERVYRVVEDDRFGQFPFMYVIVGADKCVLVDTGCGTGDYLSFVARHFNPRGLPYLVVNTHIHFDHVGGNAQFQDTPGFLGTCVGGRCRAFSENYPLNSLVLGHPGASLRPFRIDRWLQPGDLIPLDDARPEDPELALRVLHTPGHTPDSIALHLPCERRIFAGDTVYPWTVIHVDCLGSSPKDYLQSTSALLEYIDALPPIAPISPISQEKQNDIVVIDDDDNNDHSSSSSSVITQNNDMNQNNNNNNNNQDELLPYQQEILSQFYSALDLTPYQARRVFDARCLLEISDWDAEAAVMTYLTNADSIATLCPPVEGEQQHNESAPSSSPAHLGLAAPPLPSEVTIACGHVAESLSVGALRELHEALLLIRAGALEPTSVNAAEGTVEYAVAEGQYVLCFPIDAQWE